MINLYFNHFHYYVENGEKEVKAEAGRPTRRLLEVRDDSRTRVIGEEVVRVVRLSTKGRRIRIS